MLTCIWGVFSGLPPMVVVTSRAEEHDFRDVVDPVLRQYVAAQCATVNVA